MRSFCQLAILALPLFSTVFADPASPTKQDEGQGIYASAHDAFQDLLNALPEESLQAAFHTLKDFKDGVFESHHRGVEQVHDNNPALATKLIVAAVHDLKKRQAAPSNGTTANPPPQSSPPPVESSRPPTVQSSNNPPPPQSTPNNPPPPSSTERPVEVPITVTTTDSRGNTITTDTSALSQVTASVPVTVTQTNAQGQTVTTTENRPAVIRTTTDSAGRTTVTTSAARFAPTSGEVLTTTDAQGSTFLTTYTPGGGKVNSIVLITTTGADGRQSVLTSTTFVDPDQPPPTGAGKTSTGKPSLQTNAANVHNIAVGAVVGGALALFV